MAPGFNSDKELMTAAKKKWKEKDEDYVAPSIEEESEEAPAATITIQ